MPLINIPFEHSDFIISDKPAGVSFHNEEGDQGFFNQLKEQIGIDLWPVHRLDKITSGLLIAAKSKKAAVTFGKMFESKQIFKTYIALSDKKPKKKQGTISGDMKKTRSGNWKITRSYNSPSITKFHTQILSSNTRLFIVTPATGQTHQIRVALKSLGSPIIGDTRYGGTDSDRGYLHALKLNFNWKGVDIDVTSPPNSGKLFNQLGSHLTRTSQLN